MPKIPMPYTVHLDHTLRVTPLSTLFAKGDSAAHRFELTILRAGVQEDLTGCTVVCKFYRIADSIVVSVPGSVEDGKAVTVLGAACYDYIGRFALTIAIKNGEDETTVFYGDGYMSGNRADTGITGDYVVYDVETLLAKIAEIETAIANANTATENANTATENAQSAANSANEAASAANTAADGANEAAGAANTAAHTANSAASSAQTATENANAATQASQTQQEAVAEAEAERATAEQARQDAELARQETFAGFEGEIGSLKSDISNMRFGDPYDGVDLSVKFADEIAGYSDIGAWIKARINAANFDGIHVNDYIPVTTTNGLSFKARVAGIDPYYEYGGSSVGHHIDFICDELWPTLHPINPVNYNNGLIPTENVTSDGSSTQYVLTKPMYGVANVTLNGTSLAGWTYDNDTYTLTFSAAPAAGTMVVTGTGSEYPWLSCDAYLYVNSLAGHVADGTSLNPAIKRVDYTNDGIYHYLPDWLKAVIIEKIFLLNKRYSATGILSEDNSWGWTNLGKLWFPTEVEVYGCPVWGGKNGYGMGSSIQYPIFIGNMRRVKKLNGGRRYWWLLSPNTSATSWCLVTHIGNVAADIASADWIAAPVCFRIG